MKGAEFTSAHRDDDERIRLAVASSSRRILAESLVDGGGFDVDDFIRRPLRSMVSDVRALVERDPAARGDWRYALDSYRSLWAVLSYRLARHALEHPGLGRRAHVIARRISEAAKVHSGVEIHPSAVIGDRLVIDHGYGTVIGETVSIGSDCYLLQGVVLGALGIAGNGDGRRHPSLGDRVEVGGFARVLGPVNVGDDVQIGCHALIREDVPSGSKVSVLTAHQVVSARRRPPAASWSQRCSVGRRGCGSCGQGCSRASGDPRQDVGLDPHRDERIQGAEVPG